jgi:hypothetical protein
VRYGLQRRVLDQLGRSLGRGPRTMIVDYLEARLLQGSGEKQDNGGIMQIPVKTYVADSSTALPAELNGQSPITTVLAEAFSRGQRELMLATRRLGSGRCIITHAETQDIYSPHSIPIPQSAYIKHRSHNTDVLTTNNSSGIPT